MKIKEIRINKFKRFSNLYIKDIPESAKLIVLVGPNGCGKTSLFEAFNHWYKLEGFGSVGNYDYYSKKTNDDIQQNDWFSNRVKINFYNYVFDTREHVKGTFYFRSAYRNEPQFITSNLKKQDDPTTRIDHETLMTTDATVSSNYQRIISST